MPGTHGTPGENKTELLNFGIDETVEQAFPAVSSAKKIRGLPRTAIRKMALFGSKALGIDRHSP
jgi:hypothetical protein